MTKSEYSLSKTETVSKGTPATEKSPRVKFAQYSVWALVLCPKGSEMVFFRMFRTHRLN